MRAWPGRVAKLLLPIWFWIYVISFRTVVTVHLYAWVGFRRGLLITFLTIFGWSVIFYLLLLEVESFDRFRGYLTQFEQKLGFLKKEKLRRRAGSLFLPLWIFLIFIFGSALEGVPAIRLSYPPKFNRRIIFLILIGCILDVLTWALPVGGLLGTLIRRFWSYVWGWLIFAWRWLTASF